MAMLIVRVVMAAEVLLFGQIGLTNQRGIEQAVIEKREEKNNNAKRQAQNSIGLFEYG